MKKIILGFCVSVFLISCKTLVVKESEVSKTLQFLSSDELNGRETGSEGIEKAAQFLESELKKKGIKPYFKTYRDSLKENFHLPAYNIVGVIEGKDKNLKNEFVILGAHYDHIGQAHKNQEGDNIANGANDNASGTTAVLQIAKKLAKQNLKRSVLVVFFTAEENGLVGSEHLAKKLKKEDFNLYTMLNFEMVGVPMKPEQGLVYISGHHYSNLAEKMNDYAKNQDFVKYNDIEKSVFASSDNYPFYKEFGVPSHTFCSFDFKNFKHYHGVDDEFELMDTQHMTQLVNIFTPSVLKLINAPTREIVLKK